MNKYLLFLVLVIITRIAYSADNRYWRPEVKEPQSIELPVMTIIGREPVVPTRNVTEVNVRVVWYETKEELNRIYHRICTPSRIPCAQGVNGFTKTGQDESKCEIHALKPEYVNDSIMNVLGHEFSHCLFGSFHQL